MNSTLIIAVNVRISRRRSGSSAFTMRLLSMCLVKKTSGVGPRRARRCVSYSVRFRTVSDSARLCGCTRTPIISICCPAIAEAAIARLTSSYLPRSSTVSETFVPLFQSTNRAGIAIGGGDLYCRVVFRLKEGGTTPARSLVSLQIAPFIVQKRKIFNLNFFGRPHLCASRPRIPHLLLLFSHNRLLRQNLKLLAPGRLTERILHQPVLQRMKADQHQPSSRLQQRPRALQQRLNLSQLVIHSNPKCLKGSRRRMNLVAFH